MWGGELPKVYANTQDLNSQTHRQGYQHLCRWIHGGQSDPLMGVIKFWPSLSLWHCLWRKKLYPTYPNPPLDQGGLICSLQIQNWGPEPRPFAHPVFPPGASTPGHREPILITMWRLAVLLRIGLSLSALLEETTKTNQEPALFQGECFHPAPTL